ncbi:MAG: hypothetical protein DRP12_00925, partial [Candidatus Aenigmatarchaeota archaeon]
EIDRAIEKYIPRKLEQEWLKYWEVRYEPDLKGLEEALSRPIWDFLDRGGKRFRPALFLLFIQALGGRPKRFMEFTPLIELAHEGSIMIDDIEDQGKLRRGRPCTHLIFGEDIAINAGNFMYFVPLLVFRKHLKPETAVRAFRIWAQELTTIHLGQALDIWWHRGHKVPTEAEYMQMCAWKSGTLLRLSARLAACLLEKPVGLEKRLGEFAEAIGIAFQIQDDVLDLIADRKRFGKAWGNDITEGKRTLMVIHACQKAGERERRELLKILDSHTRDRQKIKRAMEIIKKYGSIEYAKQRSREIVEKAWKQVDRILPESEAKQKLRAFAEFLIQRSW